YLSPKSFLYFVFLIIRLPPISTLFPYTTLFRSERRDRGGVDVLQAREFTRGCRLQLLARARLRAREVRLARGVGAGKPELCVERSEEHTSELQSLAYLVCRLLLEKKKTIPITIF